MKKKAHFIIQGRVQGVCYRMYACEEAERLGLAGWVRNKADGTVEIVAEGEENDLAAFLCWCRRGPSYAKVTGIIEKYSDVTGEFDEFMITG
ncbi:MAG: acylphosphatase [Kiritimatiellae bacterium]|nr:acylphosphatase [Kiritimatiellia bacterium]MDD5521043.1 acylphosphatase [Kiritimatiellia bacterium]